MSVDTYLNSTLKHNVIQRLKIVRGHLGKVISMVELDEACFKILHQTKAVRFALKKVDQILLEEFIVNAVDGGSKTQEFRQEIHRSVSMYRKIYI